MPLGLGLGLGLGSGAAGGAAWVPTAEFFGATFGDFWDAGDATRMFQNAAVSTLVVTTGDPLCGWVGGLDTITIKQSTTASGLLYDADGYAYDPENTVRRSIYDSALATTGFLQTQSITVAVSAVSGNSAFDNVGAAVGWGATLGATGCGVLLDADGGGTFRSRNTGTSAGVTDSADVLRGYVCSVTSGTSGVGYTRSGGAVALSVGTFTGLGDTFGIDGSVAAGEGYRYRRILLIYRAVTADEAANILAWLER